MKNKIKYMSIKEFREKGYLQELNRRFLHPLGLALEVIVDDKTGEERLGGIWDYRDDPEGIYYDFKNSSKDRVREANRKYTYIQREILKRAEKRKELFDGDFLEPIPDIEDV